MASFNDVLAANEALRTRFESVTAIFTGATHGLGLATLRAFTKHIPKPRAIIIGRSRERFENELRELQLLNPGAKFQFIESELSLIRAIDTLCGQLRTELSSQSVDLLYMSHGYAPVEGRKYTIEGLDEVMTLGYYGRVRFVENLIAMDALRHNASLVSVFGGGKEGKLFEDDLALERNYSIMNIRGHFASLMALAWEGLSQSNPELRFMHVFPGRVSTGFLERSVHGWLKQTLAKYILEPILTLGGISAAESGERILWMAMGGSGNFIFTKGSVSLDWDGSESTSEWLARYRHNAALLHCVRQFNEGVFEAAKRQ
ncbi:hypothetical protein LTR37_000513 [Vermiconidia calcicola]|uniref:Uncharacterized protein n=1 Tax=Vermiconidia calcicola TaxID=1690605 RepID=A0ACC3NZ71_9PEZI|nr:hypothetical protein LTR37_000513 [Vermiconidia calcicola]